MKYLFLLYFICFGIESFGQSGKLSGTILDAETKAPLELATISVAGTDSSLMGYQLSDKQGKFLLEKLPLKKKLYIGVSYTGFTTYHTTVILNSSKADSLIVLLTISLKDTTGVVVKVTAPVRMNGDTLEINPSAFKMKPGAVVEELLNQVTGIVIWSDGSMTVNGKKVQNLFVDGKPFLGSTDPRVATQNLPKEAIDKIQLYQEYDRSQIGQQVQPVDSLLTMNIKLKEGSKKGYFGKAGAGYGTTDRYESDFSFQVYNKKSSAGIGGGANNINKNIGNIQDMLQNNTFRNFNPNLYNVGRFGASGINRNYSVGSVYTHNFIESSNSRQNNRITINYNTSGTNSNVTDLTLQNRTTINNPQFVREEGVQNNRNFRNDIGIYYVRTNSYNDNLSLNGAANTSNNNGQSTRFSEVRDTANTLQSTNRINSVQKSHGEGASVSMNFARSDGDEPLKNFNVQLNARYGQNTSDRDVNSLFQSYIDMSQNTSYVRHYASANHSVNVSGNFDYTGFKRLVLGRYNLFGISINFNQGINYNKTSDRTLVTDYDSTIKKYTPNNEISSQNERTLFEYTPTLALSKSFYTWGGSYGRNIFIQLRMVDEFKRDNYKSSIDKRNLDRSFQFFRYEGNLGYSYNKREVYQMNISMNYSRNYDYPSIDQLYPIIDNINAYDIRIGNPDLSNRLNNRLNVNLNYNMQKPRSLYTLNVSVNGGYNWSVDPITDSVINDRSGKRFTYYTNADRSTNYNVNYNLNVARRINKSQLQFMYNGQYNTGKTPNYIDNIYNTSATSSISNQVTLQFTLNTLLVLNLNQSFQQYKTGQSAIGLTSFTNRSNSTRLGIVLNAPENMSISSTVDRVQNANLDKPTLLWNAFATYRFMKQQGELKFSAMDILKQYENISISANSYGTSTRITNGLQQYFLLTFSYYPRKFGKTELKKQGAE